MKTKAFFVYGGYLWTKTLLSLTFHPNKMIQETLRRPVLLPVIFSPIIGLIVLFVTAKIASYAVDIYGYKRDLIAIFLSTTLLSIMFWQALLFYLLGSYLVASRKKSGI